MQIQRTGYQQNFGTPVVAPIKGKSLIEALAEIDYSFTIAKNPHLYITPLFEQGTVTKVLFADAEHAKLIRDAYVPLSEDKTNLSKIKYYNTVVKGVLGDPQTVKITEEISNPEDLIAKIPMLQQFRESITNIFKGGVN